MESKIEGLTEAFSMQPQSWFICRKEKDYHKYAPTEDHKHKKGCLASITTGFNYSGDPVYVGINYDGEKVFEILAKSVNVFYQ